MKRTRPTNTTFLINFMHDIGLCNDGLQPITETVELHNMIMIIAMLILPESPERLNVNYLCFAFNKVELNDRPVVVGSSCMHTWMS